jgi:hypothetical protein
MSLLLALLFTTQLSQEQTVIRLVDQAEARRESQLMGYTVTERYTLKGTRLIKAAAMTVDTTYRKNQGKTFQVTSRTGSGLAQSQVFDRLLREEGEMSRGEGRRTTLLTSENYQIHLTGEDTSAGRNCYIVQLIPRLKGTHLLRGRAWIDKADGSLIRIEGTPTADSSVFAGRPEIVRQYENISGVWLSRMSSAVADSFISGKTQVTIDSLDYRLLN